MRALASGGFQLPGAESVVIWCSGCSYRNSLVNSLMAQHTCLHSSALQTQTQELVVPAFTLKDLSVQSELGCFKTTWLRLKRSKCAESKTKKVCKKRHMVENG